MGVKPSHILGMNARYFYAKLNPRSAKQYGFSKLRSKALFKEHDIPSAELYHLFTHPDQIDAIKWENIPVPFVIKPASGSAGKGIIPLVKKKANQPIWSTAIGETYDADALSTHVRNILDGEFTTWGSDHQALVEELIPPHPKLAKYSHKGTPDIRVIVFNGVPLMAELRLPSKESNGRANMSQGAFGLGVDIASGVTTYGLHGMSKSITYFPDSKKKVNGILIPHWKEILLISTKAALAAGYYFMGADIFIHPEKGPMLVELNGFPGLSIQLANRDGLKRRMNRVEGLDVRDAEHGVKIAQALFAESFADQITSEEGLQIIPINPKVEVYDERNKKHQIQAIVNTGRTRSVISEELADQFDLADLDDLLWQQEEGIEGKLPVIEIKIRIKGRTIKTAMIVSRRLNRTKHKIEIGKRDLSGFLIGETTT